MSRKHEREALEKRAVELRAEEAEGGGALTVDAVVLGQSTRIRDWRTGEEYEEMFGPSALARTDLSDVLLCANHEYEMIPLARSKNGKGSLKLEVTPQGLTGRTVLDIEGNPYASMLYSAVQRGDMTGASFMFRVGADHWDLARDPPLRVIDDISIIHEISVVNDPAYPQTSVTARSAEETGPSPLEEARARARAEEEAEARARELEMAKARNTIKVKL